MKRRKFLARLTTFLAGVAAGVAAVPFVRSLVPRGKAPLRIIQIEFAKLQPGQILAVATPWSSVVYVLYRTPEMLESLAAFPDLADPLSDESVQPDSSKNETRSITSEILVVDGACTHLGCSVSFLPPGSEFFPDGYGRFYCPCHGSVYDLAGRVAKNMSAPKNLMVPNHKFVDERTIEVSEPRVKS